MRGDNPIALYLGLGALAALVLAVDFVTPLGIAVWILYLVPVALTLLQRRPLAPIVAATTCSLLILLTAFTDEPGMTRQVAYVNRAFGLVVIWGVALLARGLIVSRARLAHEEWIRSTQMRLLEALQGERSLKDIGERTLSILGATLGAPVAAFHARSAGELRLTASVGLREGGDAPPVVRIGEGLIGEAARTQRVTVLEKVPEAFFNITSALGSGRPRHLAIAPALTDGITHGVVEFGLLKAPTSEDRELLERVTEGVAVAIRTAHDRDRLRALLEETQRQAEELQAQQEELRVANEELEEQSQALKASQERLELQQTELEATNAQLEIQAQELEQQRLAAEQSRTEAERASQYKSDFLANMSHELRTPLNSALILAKLLAQNKDGRLSAEQVRYAETIHSAGNSLLTLINDILDLSKIEAGAVEIHPEPISPRALLETLQRSVQPVAEQKHLQLTVDVAPGTPDRVTTDGQRLQQVLTNLVSNALKFTDRGGVSLNVAPADGDRVAFRVVDTGKGIPRDKFEAIFEAFQQVDAGVSRTHTGTGLGLSISRELAVLLGGDVRVESELGAGSTFTVTIPTTLEVRPASPPDRRAGQPRPPVRSGAHPQAASAPANAAHGAMLQPARRVPDDREARQRPGRLILVVEDDEAFARILYELAHELDFDCAIATSTEEGMRLARELMPSGVLLDVQLPDASGLSLLDRLKRNPDTRHIPVHVVSVSDYRQTALELGAVGYALKPVEREELAAAITRLEAKLQQRVHRVLLVEDDEQLRASLRALLRLDDVLIDDVGTAQDALRSLESTSYDCVVLDLNLPDASGYDVLETMSSSEKYSFPPVIVYTGRALSREDEERLRRYSRSVIVKGARSPERLLDEVTLFLHQVESRLPAESQRLLKAARERDEFFEGKTILVVEDDVRNVFALSSVFEPAGARVEIARNGREALDQVARSRPDLVLMDIMMPEMDGLTAIRELRRQPEYRDLPIIALTAKAMPDDYERTIAAGANDYLAKPLDVDKLLSLSRVWMSR